MNQKPQNLGPVKAWQIREFPELLREEIVARAELEGVSISEFATAIWVAVRDNGWQVGSGGFLGVGNPRRLEVIRELTELGTIVAQHHEGLGKSIAGSLKALLRQELRALRSGPPQKALTHEPRSDED